MLCISLVNILLSMHVKKEQRQVIKVREKGGYQFHGVERCNILCVKKLYFLKKAKVRGIAMITESTVSRSLSVVKGSL